MTKNFFPKKGLQTVYGGIKLPVLDVGDDVINTAHDASFDVAMLYDILLNKYSTEKKIMYHCLQNAESTITRSRNSPTKRKASTQTNNPTAKKKKETTIPTDQSGMMFNFFFNPLQNHSQSSPTN